MAETPGKRTQHAGPSGTGDAKRLKVGVESGKGGSGRSPVPSKRQVCHYGYNCYRTNPSHFSELSHPYLEQLLESFSGQDLDNVKIPESFQTRLDSPTIIEQLRAIKDLGLQQHVPSSSRSGKNSVANQKEVCQYAETCYRKSTEHFAKFSHPQLEELLSRFDGKDLETVDLPDSFKSSVHKSTIIHQLCLLRDLDETTDVPSKKDNSHNSDQSPCRRPVVRKGAWHGRVNKKLEKAAPYYLFLTTVTASPQTHAEPLSITFTELLDKSLGELDSSLQINFMVEIDWLMEQYRFTGNEKKPLLIIYGAEDDTLRDPKLLPSNVGAIRVKPPSIFGHHHTKMSLFYYTDGSLRVVVSTANLIESDWDNRTQGLWVSPACPQMDHSADTTSGESPTEFKADLLRYLCEYKLARLQDWVGRVRRADFSKIRVWLIASVPRSHKGGQGMNLWGHLRLSSILRKHAREMDQHWPIVAQFSSIGTLGTEPVAWMCGELLHSMCSCVGSLFNMRYPSMKAIYPSYENVVQSYDGLLGGSCLPYSEKTHQKQKWFTGYLNQWKSSDRHRSRAMPHIKTYTRLSPNNTEIGWFHLTSANLSKAAWGMLGKDKNSLYIMSYEAGVLFLPKFLIGSDVFKIESSGQPFPMPYDVPLTSYQSEDKPWFMDYLR